MPSASPHSNWPESISTAIAAPVSIVSSPSSSQRRSRSATSSQLFTAQFAPRSVSVSNSSAEVTYLPSAPWTMLLHCTMQPVMQLCIPPPRVSKLSTIRAPSRVAASGDWPDVRFLYGNVCSMFAIGTTELVPCLNICGPAWYDFV
jgi:hypothetical protein